MIETLQDLAKAYKVGPHGWPGGYPLYLLLVDGAVLCRECFKEEYGQPAWDIRYQCDTGWCPSDLFINWEDEGLVCDHCNESLPSAYGEPDINE